MIKLDLSYFLLGCIALRTKINEMTEEQTKTAAFILLDSTNYIYFITCGLCMKQITKSIKIKPKVHIVCVYLSALLGA